MRIEIREVGNSVPIPPPPLQVMRELVFSTNYAGSEYHNFLSESCFNDLAKTILNLKWQGGLLGVKRFYSKALDKFLDKRWEKNIENQMIGREELAILIAIAIRVFLEIPKKYFPEVVRDNVEERDSQIFLLRDSVFEPLFYYPKAMSISHMIALWEIEYASPELDLASALIGAIGTIKKELEC